ncbi:hypothetical protein AAC387_Pa12g1592 [Persea americana]
MRNSTSESRKFEDDRNTSNTRKSERIGIRLGGRTPVVGLVKRKREERERMAGPLRKSERGDKQRKCQLSSLSSPDSRKKKANEEERSGRKEGMENREHSNKEKTKEEGAGMVLRTKRLDARTYRASFKPQPRKVKQSGLAEKQRRVASLEDNGNFSEKHKKEDELREKYIGEGVEKSVERSGSGLRALEGDNTSRSSRKRKFCAGEASESKCRNVSQIPKLGDSLIQSSSDGSVARTLDDDGDSEIDCSGKRGLQNNINDSARTEVGCCKRGEFQSPELAPSTSSRGRAVAYDVDSETTGRVGYLKSNSLVLESDVSLTVKEASCSPETSSADDISVSPSIRKSHKLTKRCDSCFKPQRVSCDSQKQEVCSCIARESPDLCERAPSKDRGKLEVNDTEGVDEEYAKGTKTEMSSLDIGTNNDLKFCIICKLGGELLCCDGKGCRRSYHLSCLDPPLNNVPYGVWHCLHCVKKKIEFGVHSACKGLESIWDAREVEVSGSFGIRKEKQYLVKYKGLAHVHNQWISEKKLLQEDALLVSKFNRKHQKEKVVRWKSEWIVPHRLLQKRLLMSQRLDDENFGRHSSDSSSCLYEWLVKWNGLGYDHATWELENAPFLSSPEGKVLIREYENRHEKAWKASDPHRADKERETSFLKLQKLPSGFHPGANNDTLNSVNKLCDYWYKRQSIVVIDDQERIMKVILFILSLQRYACLPFLVVSTPSALPIWENELSHLAPSVNVVVYSGKKDVRKCIRTLEFYEEHGRVTFEVLVSSPEDVVEDFEQLRCIGWAAIIIDECQHSRVSRHLNQIRKLTSEFRLLLHNGPIKDNVAEYLNLLTLLDSVGDGTCVDSLNLDSSDSVEALPLLKERLAKFIAYERKSDSKFVEYWVPVQLSKVQLEQYCASLLSNFVSLRSCAKNDSIGDLRDIVISLRKCCDHPYLVDISLQNTLTKGLPETEYLDVGVNASGKLQLLDKILAEMKNQGLRVLILFQSIAGSGRISIGDILDDFLRQRFGPDCYERVDVGLVASKRQAALNMFNDKERGRFVFLIENRACHPSIKLSSVDTIIIFGSDWNPFIDLRSLQRIYIDSKFQQLKVFRFYSSFTVEEKVLILAKQDMTLESNIRNTNRITSHMLLMWGASYLFNKLDEFHGFAIPTICSSTSDLSLFDDVVSELLTQLPPGADTNNKNICSVILDMQTGTIYPKDVSLLGELEMQSTDEELPHVFWSKLLERRYPLWKYLSGSSQRARKKVQHFDEILKAPEGQNNEARRKRKKVSNTTVDPISTKAWLEDKRKVVASECEAKMPDSAMIAQGSSGSSLFCSKESPIFSVKEKKDSGLPGTQMIQSDGRRKLFDAQKSLHLLLKPAISRLCETLQLPENVRHMVGKFLEYIMHNHRVSREPETILQAFQLSLCWMAASLLKHQLDRKSSLVLATQYLNFMCKEEEVASVYSRLKVLKKRFSPTTGALQNTSQGQSTVPRKDDVARHLIQERALKTSSSNQVPDLMQARTFKSFSYNQQELEGDIREYSHSLNLSDGRLSVEQQAPDGKAENSRVVECDAVVTPLSHANENVSQNVEAYNRSIKRIHKVCAQRRRMILMKQHEELEEFMNFWNREKEKLKKAQRLEADLISTIHDNALVKSDKLKKNDEYFARKMDELETRMETIQSEIVAKQNDARNKEKRIKKGWFDAAKKGRLPQSFLDLPFTESAFKLDSMMTGEQNRVPNVSENAKVLPEPSSDPEHAGATIPKPVELTVRTDVSTEAAVMIPNKVSDGIYTDTVSPMIHSSARNIINCENEGMMGNAALKKGANAQVDKHGEVSNFDGLLSTSAPTQSWIDLPSSSPSHDKTISLQQPQLHPSTDVFSGEHNQPHASATARSNPEPDLQLQVSALTDDPPVKCNQPVKSATTESESESAQQLRLISDVLPVKCTQPVISTATVTEPVPVHLQLPSSIDIPSVRPNQPDTSIVTGSSTDPAIQLEVELPLSTDAESAEFNQLDTSSIGSRSEPEARSGRHNSSQQTVVTQQNIQPKVVMEKNVEAIPLPPSTDALPAEFNQLDRSSIGSRSESGSRSERHNSSQTTVATLQNTGAMPLPPPIDALSAECNQLDNSSIGSRSEPESRSEHNFSQPTVVTQQNIEATPPPPFTDALSAECNQLDTSSIGTRSEPESRSERPNSFQPTVVIQQNIEALPLPPSADALPVKCNQLNTSSIGSRREPESRSAMHNCSQPTVVTQQNIEDIPLPPSTDALSECNQLDISSIGSRREPESRSEGHNSSQPTVAMQQNIEDISSHLQQYNNLDPESNIQLALHVPTDMPSGGIPMGDPGRTRMPSELNNLAPMTTRQFPPRYLDPFQNELAKLRFQEEQLVRMLEDVKTRFSSECEKEVEEVRRKYDSLIQNEDKTFMETKQMLEVYCSKVHLNMILGEAFKIKCIDARPGGQQSRPGLSSTTMHRFPVPPLPQNAWRSPRSPAPPVQVVHHSSALFSSNLLAPHSNAVIPTSTVIPRVNLQSGSGLRATPPHLHPFRPSMSAPSHSPPFSGITSQASLNHPTAAQPLPSLHQPQVPSYPPGAFTGTQSQVSSGTFPAVYNPSNLELLMDVVGNRSGANLLRPLAESNLDTWLLSGQTMVGTGRGSTGTDNVGPVAAMDVVCLSDDDQ